MESDDCSQSTDLPGDLETMETSANDKDISTVVFASTDENTNDQKTGVVMHMKTDCPNDTKENAESSNQLNELVNIPTQNESNLISNMTTEDAQVKDMPNLDKSMSSDVVKTKNMSNMNVNVTTEDLQSLNMPLLHERCTAKDSQNLDTLYLHANNTAEDLQNLDTLYLHANKTAEDLQNLDMPYLHENKTCGDLQNFDTPYLHENKIAEDLQNLDTPPHLHANKNSGGLQKFDSMKPHANETTEDVIILKNNNFSHIHEECKTPKIQLQSKNLRCNLIAKSTDFGKGNYCKGCKWSPDGLCFLVNNDDSCIKLYNTPTSLVKQEWSTDSHEDLKPCLSAAEPEIVYDFCWWPQMNSADPATCCFVTCARDQPVHLWDAFNGELRASYIALNSVHEIQAANSLAFCPSGQQLLCGSKREIFLFYTDRPGSDFERWSTCKKKSSKKQNNIISCIDFGPDGTVFACGCYDGTVGLYSPVNGHLLELIPAHSHGVTQVKFSNDGVKLYTGSRNENALKCWDIRYLQDPVFELSRKVDTNQRVYFDLIANQEKTDEIMLVSGATDGVVRLWDLGEKPCSPSLSFTAHNDCVNGCTVHPFLPLLLTTSGQRKYANPLDSDDESDGLLSTQNVAEENTVKIWLISNTLNSQPMIE